MSKQSFLLAFFMLLSVFLKAQTCPNSSSIGAPTKCFEIESILADACSSVEGEDEMIRLRIGPNPIALNSINTVNWQTINSWLGFCSITGATLTKVNNINSSIASSGNCGRLIPVNPGGTIPAYAKVLFITSTDFSSTAHSFAGLTDTMYVIMQCNGNTSGHFTNSGNTNRTFIMRAGTCGDTVNWNSSNLTGGNGATINFTYSGVPTYVNYGCAIPVTPFSVDAGTANPSYCNGSTVSLAGNVTGTNCFVWQATDTATGSFSDTTSLSTTFNIRTGYIGAVKLYLKVRSNCSFKTDSVMFNAVAALGVLNAGRDTALCNSVSFQPNASTTATGTYIWTEDGAGTLNLTNILNPIYTPTVSDLGTVNLILTQATSCGTLIDTVKINYSSKLNPSFTLSDSLFCYNNIPININLSPTVLGGVFTSNIGTITSNVHTFNAAGNFTIKYKIGSGSCADSLTKPIIAYSQVNPSFTIADTVVCKNEPFVALTPTQLGGVFSGTRVVGSTFNPDTVGIFSIKYVLANGTCRDSVTKTIEVKTKANPSFTLSDSLFCYNNVPISINLTPNVSGGVFTSNIGFVIGNVHTFNAIGNFIIKYKIGIGNCADSLTKPVISYAQVNPSFIIADTVVCKDEPFVALTPTQLGGVFSGTRVVGSTFNPDTVGIFSIKYLLANGTCRDSLTKTIEVKPKPNSLFTFSKNNFCLNDSSITLIPTETGGLFSGNNVVGNKFVPSSIGLFAVKYLISNSTCSDSTIETFTVNAKPNASFTVSDTLVCVGSTNILLTPTALGGTFYGTNISGSLFLPVDTGLFAIKYQIANGNCIDSSIKNIAVLPKPNAAFTVPDSVFCINNPRVTFTPLVSGGVFSGTNVLGSQFLPNTVGTFLVKYLVGSGQCADSSFKTMVVNNKPTATFRYVPTNAVVGDTVNFIYTGSSATSYFWKFGDDANTTSTLKDPFIIYNNPKVYNVSLKVTNNFGCEDSIQKNVTVKLKETLFVPNVFTPQGDGINDYFNISSYGIESLNMKIFNRWGGLIFETNTLTPGWDGTFNGDFCSEGVYFYIIEAKFFSNTAKTTKIHGTVTLLR